MLPVFVKGHLTFCLDKQDLEFIHQNISVFGVTGLPWGPLNPRDHFGKEVMVSIRVAGPEPLSLLTRADIMREHTSVGEHMALKFRFEPDAKAKLAQVIQKHGYYPTEYLRKYPRIPSSPMIQTFPLRALAFVETDSGAGGAPLIFDIANLSPNGILLTSENQSALTIQPGARLNLQLEPRGWFPMSIRVQGLVCRVSDEIGPHGNLLRYLGIKFTKVDDVNRTAFLDLLKDILARIKNQAAESAKKP
jgi:hypothetical protein